MDFLVKILFALPVYQSVVLCIILFASGTRRFSYPRMLMGIFQLLMAFYFTFNFLYSLRAYDVVTVFYFLILPVILMLLICQMEALAETVITTLGQ